MKSKLLTIVLFVFCAVPGVMMFVFSSIILIAEIIDPYSKGQENKFVLLAVSLAGMVLTLIGIGKWNRWMYSLVFLSIPISFWICGLIIPDSGLLCIFLVTVSAFLTLTAIRRYYQKRELEKENDQKSDF